MTFTLEPAATPVYAKVGFYGHTGTGKTFTLAKVASQFIRDYCPDRQLAIFDTEPSAGYIKDMVGKITGKNLLAIVSRSFSELLLFADQCREQGYVAALDSATHPWRDLMSNYLTAKASRIKAAGGNPRSVRLTLKDWGPIKDTWSQFAEKFCFDPVHWFIAGREGDVWETMTDDEGQEELQKTGTKMKTETELGYEPALLTRMSLRDGKHIAEVVKDRFDLLTGQRHPDPDIEFFRPWFDNLDLVGKHRVPNPNPPEVFPKGHGRNPEAVRRQREALLENIKDDLLVVYPSTGKDDRLGKVTALRTVFDTSAWTELEGDWQKYPLDRLEKGRKSLAIHLKGLTGNVSQNSQ